jgi:hypothetical protein
MVTIGIHLCKCKRRRKTGKQLEIREGNRRGWLEGSHPSSNCLVFFSCFFYKSSSPLICVLSPALVVPPPPSPPPLLLLLPPASLSILERLPLLVPPLLEVKF